MYDYSSFSIGKVRILLCSIIFSSLSLSATAQEEQESDKELVQEAVTVTGSLIPNYGNNLIETSPITSISGEEIKTRGVLRVEDLINNLPQAFADQGTFLANGSSGTASINLRGLGASRTLVLMNGLRLPYGSAGTVAPDVNSIPKILIKQIDLLTGGSSATYGSDALAGVVNFVLDTEYEGIGIDVNYSFYQHDNSDTYIQNILQGYADDNPSQFRVPTGSVVDGHAYDLSLKFGTKFSENRGYISGFLDFQRNDAVIQDSRDYSQCALGTSGTDFTCSGSSTNQVANLLDVDSNYVYFDNDYANPLTNPTGWQRVDISGDQSTLAARNFSSDTFNYNPYNHYIRPNQRLKFGSFMQYDINDSAKVYAQLMFVDSRSNSQIAPSGVFGLGVSGGSGGVNCDNPYLSKEQRETLCGNDSGSALTYTLQENINVILDADGNVVTDQLGGSFTYSGGVNIYNNTDAENAVIKENGYSIGTASVEHQQFLFNEDTGLSTGTEYNQDIHDDAFLEQGGYVVSSQAVQDNSGNYNIYNPDNSAHSDLLFETLSAVNGYTQDALERVGGIAPVVILRRNVEGGNRNEDLRHTTYYGVLGLKGDIPGSSNIGYDISLLSSNVHYANFYKNDLSKSRIANALYAIGVFRDADGNIVEQPDGSLLQWYRDENGDPAIIDGQIGAINPDYSTEIACRVNVDSDTTNDDANCAPYDIFSTDGPSAASTNYLAIPLLHDANIGQTVITAKLFGSLEEIGLISPIAEEAIAFAAGYEYRKDTLDRNPDERFQIGDGAGQGGPTLAYGGSIETHDVFAELNLPIVQGKPFVEQFGFDVGWRLSSYSNLDNVANAYKIGVDYAPVEDIRFRGSYQRAIRAPNIFELFAPAQIGLFDLSEGANGLYDPCASSSISGPEASLEECMRTGVTANQYGNIADNPAGQFNTREGGNFDLTEEVSDTFVGGVVIRPRFIEELAISVDYFNIRINGYIDSIDSNLVLNNCINDINAEYFCSFVNRGDSGSLWVNSTGYIEALDINLGYLATSGIDINASYGVDIGRFGDMDFRFVATVLLTHETKPLPNSPSEEIYDCVGYYGGSCGIPNPVYRHKFDATWRSPWNVNTTITWRLLDAVDIAASSDQPGLSGSYAEINKTLPIYNYLDVSVGYNINDNISLRFGINNIIDQDPPLSSVVGTAPGNGNTYPQVYDALGRYFFFGASLDF